jgi:DNA-binding transcriptional regulator GbsR (MarR family)
MSKTLPPRVEATRRKFIEAGGQTTLAFGLGRTIGQLFALLYLSPKALCLDEIAEELGVSKASVSTTVRQLERWSAVRHVWVKGDRRDYYEAEADFNVVVRNGLLHTLRKKLDTAGVQLEQVERSLQQAFDEVEVEQRGEVEIVAERLKRAKEFHNKVHALIGNPLIEHLL